MGFRGYVRFQMLAKAVLQVPTRGEKQKRHGIKDILSSRLTRWQQGDLCSLWQEAKLDSRHNQCHRVHPSSSSSNVHQSLKLTVEGQYSDAMNA